MTRHTHGFDPVCLGEGVEHGEGCHTVHHGVVHLEKAGRAPALEPFDQVRLPQRPHVIEGRREHGPGEIQQVTLGRWFGRITWRA